MKVIQKILVAACFLSASVSSAQTPFVQSDLNVHVASLRDTPAEERTAVFVVHTNSKLPPIEGPFVALVRHVKPLEALTLQDIRHDSVSLFVGHSNGAVNNLNVGGTSYRVRGPSRVVANFRGAEVEVAWAPVVGGSASYLTIYQNRAILLFIGSKLIANISGDSADKLRADISSGSGLTNYTLDEGGLKARGYRLEETTPLGILNTDGAVPCVGERFKIFASQSSESGEVKRTQINRESLLFLTSHKEAAAGVEAKGPVVVALHYNEEQQPETYIIRPSGKEKKDECEVEFVK